MHIQFFNINVYNQKRVYFLCLFLLFGSSFLSVSSAISADHYIPDGRSDRDIVDSYLDQYNWTRGCSPTSAAMVLSYADNRFGTFGNLICWYFEHPPTGAMGQSENVSQLIDWLADAMLTNEDGGTAPSAIHTGIMSVTNYSRSNNERYTGYNFNSRQVNSTQPEGSDWCWDVIKEEINNDRPFVWSMIAFNPIYQDSDGHSLAAVGYTDDKRVIVRDPNYSTLVYWTYNYWYYDDNPPATYTVVDTVERGGDYLANVKLNYPLGGERFYPGSTVTISWYASGSNIETVDLSYSIDGGNTWLPVGLGHYRTLIGTITNQPWTVPAVSSTKCRVRIEANDFNGARRAGDGSKSNFTIAPNNVLESITINGPTQVNESSFDQFSCTANFSDSSTQNVTNSASWSENCAYASISSTGYFSTSAVTADQSCTITASYSGQSASKSVTIKNVAGTLTSISINGASQVNENSGTQYTSTANYSDGTTQDVTSSTTWSENSSYASISSAGYLSTLSVTSDQSMSVSASYSGQSASKSVTIKNVTDTVSPTASVSTPTTGNSYGTRSALLSIGGSASDNVAVTAVNWSTDRGNSGICNGTTNWSGMVSLLSGVNVVTVVARDAAGNTGADTLTVTYTPPYIDIGVFRPSTGWWYLDLNKDLVWSGCGTDGCFYFGTSADVPVTGDWDGDGITDIGVFRPSTGRWYLDLSGDQQWSGCGADGCFYYGTTADTAVAGDWNNDGFSEIGVFRPSTGWWYLDFNGDNEWSGCTFDKCIYFGTANDKPVAGDWNNSGYSKIGVFRPSTGMWYLDLNGNGQWDGCGTDRCIYFGMNGDLPVVGDWNGDGSYEVGTFRPTTGYWYLDLNGNGQWDGCGVDGCYYFGTGADLPVVGIGNGF
jgi:hypothetical protein